MHTILKTVVISSTIIQQYNNSIEKLYSKIIVYKWYFIKVKAKVTKIDFGRAQKWNTE